MNHHISEMTAWSPSEIEREIRIALPEGWGFACGLDAQAGVWFVRFTRGEEVCFERQGIETRLLYLDAYGWLWAQQQPKPNPASAWQRRGEVTLAAVQRRALRSTEPDPGDLDPTEIDAVVYDALREPKKG